MRHSTGSRAYRLERAFTALPAATRSFSLPCILRVGLDDPPLDRLLEDVASKRCLHIHTGLVNQSRLFADWHSC